MCGGVARIRVKCVFLPVFMTLARRCVLRAASLLLWCLGCAVAVRVPCTDSLVPVCLSGATEGLESYDISRSADA